MTCHHSQYWTALPSLYISSLYRQLRQCARHFGFLKMRANYEGYFHESSILYPVEKLFVMTLRAPYSPSSNSMRIHTVELPYEITLQFFFTDHIVRNYYFKTLFISTHDNLPWDKGDIIWKWISVAAELLPVNVTLLGSPPKYLMLSLIHLKAITWSCKPILPLHWGMPRSKNPFETYLGLN